MLHILLLILKILGIILLILAVFLLFLLCAVLFVAASWRIDLKKGDTFQVYGYAGWLFRIITVRYRLDTAEGWNQHLQIRLFGFPVLKPFDEKKSEKEKRKRLRKKKKQKKRPEEKPGKSQTQESFEGSRAVPEPQMEEEAGRPAPKEKASAASDAVPGRNRKRRRVSILLLFRKLALAIRSFCDKIRHIWQGILRAGDTIRGLLKKKDDLLEFWELKEHKDAREAVWKEAGYLWKRSRPKKIQGKVIFGFDDPSVTGLCLGGVSMLYAWYPKKLQIIPDFDKKIFTGDIQIRGKIRFYVFVCILWRIYFNRNIRHMYKHWKEL